MEITEDHSMMNMRFIRKLPVPKEVKELYPLSEKGAAAKAARDAEIAKVFKGPLLGRQGRERARLCSPPCKSAGAG